MDKALDVNTVSLGFGKDIIRECGVYTAFIRNAFLNMLAYRMRYFTGIITYLLFVSVHYFIWSAVYANRPEGATVNGFSLSQIVTYVALGWVSRSLYFSNIDEEINQLVRTGQISVYLLRPVQFHLMMICQAAGESLFRLLFFTFPISVVILYFFPVSAPLSLGALLLFLISVFCSFLVLAELNFAVGMLAFSIKSIEGIMRAKYFIVQLLSGLLLPIAFFPEVFQQIIYALPFQAIAAIPLEVYLGKLSGGAARSMIGVQLFWFVLLFLIGQWMWRKAVIQLTLQGG